VRSLNASYGPLIYLRIAYKICFVTRINIIATVVDPSCRVKFCQLIRQVAKQIDMAAYGSICSRVKNVASSS
jgi:hypothetical protein